MMRHKRSGPLKTICGFDEGKEVLECGHRQYPVVDIIGPTNAYRRRCWQCGKKAASLESGEDGGRENEINSRIER